MGKMKPELIIIIGVVCGALSLFLLPYGFQELNRIRQAMKGKLMTPEIAFQKPFEVNLGSNILIQTISELSGGINLSRFINVGYEYPIQIKFKDRKLLISADIKNKDGVTIAKIVDNDWLVNENKIIASDRNYNDYAFEVIDSDRIPVLQVYLKDQNKIYIGGLFYFPKGRMLVTPNGIIINPSSDQINEYIEPIFRYPSDKYLGQMAIPETFFETPLGIATMVYGIATVIVVVSLFLRGKI